MKTIYKLDSKGKVRYLKLYTEGSFVVQESGLLDSPKSVINKSECIAKNIGKVNETTPEEQAKLEMESKLKIKLEEGYFETIEEAENAKVILPMLAKDFSKEESKIEYPVFIQPKLDGMRCITVNQSLISRKNKEITTMKHILEEVKDLGIMLDGELYAYGLSFQDNMKLIKKYVPNESEKVKYHVYDLIIRGKSFKERYEELVKLTQENEFKYLELVPTHICRTKEDIQKYHSEFISQGYEGSIIRWGDQEYEINKRSSYLLKLKDFLDEACEIVDVIPSEKRQDQGIFICKLEDGRTFGTGMRFNFEEREEILRNKSNYIGKTAEIRFFEWTDDGLPRFPVCVGLRLDK